MAGTAVRGRLTWQVATVTSVIRETDAVRTIGLDVPDWPGHRAGQHLDVRLTAEDGYTAERSYSIASADGEPVAETVVYLRGPGTVVRCRNCSGMLMVISQIRGMNCVDLHGLAALDPRRGG
jgi:ferredoxin-NADP reductase